MNSNEMKEASETVFYDRAILWCDAGGGVLALTGAVLAVIDPLDWRNWGLLSLGAGFIYAAQRGKKAHASKQEISNQEAQHFPNAE